MIPRRVLLGGGLAALASHAVAQERVEIAMRGSARGERVWFSPQGLAVGPGTTLRFVNRDPGNSHTSTAYHPDLLGRQRRIPGPRPRGTAVSCCPTSRSRSR